MKNFFAFISLLLILLTACTPREGARTDTVLGTVCSINAYEDGSPSLYDELFFRLHEIENRFSTKIPSSDISLVNEAAGKNSVVVHEDVFLVLQKALDFALMSDGVFDPTVGPLVNLWNINSETVASDFHVIPSEEDVKTALSLVDFRDVVMEDGSVFLKRKGMALDLGGIAKGYAADEVVRILSEKGVKRAVINLGGNVYVYGKKSSGEPWRVGIKNPYAPYGEPIFTLALEESASVVTSGAYERSFKQNGIFYHHIIDTTTGYPCEVKCGSVTVVGKSSLESDALSTIAFILGREKFYEKEFSKTVPTVFVNADGTVLASEELLLY